MENFESDTQSPQANDFDIFAEINKYLKYWYFFLISTLFFFIAAKVYLRYSTPIYQSSSEIKILDDNASSFKLPTSGINFFGRPSKKGLDNEIEMIKSYQLMERVVNNLNLTTSYYSVGLFTTVELWNNQPFTVNWLLTKEELQNKSIRFEIQIVDGGYEVLNGKTKSSLIKFNDVHIISGIPFKLLPKKGLDVNVLDGKKFAFQLQPTRTVALGLSASINVSTLANQSDILSISLTGPNTKKIEATINEIVKQFDLDGIKDRQLVSQRTIDFVNNRFDFLGKQLDSIENDKEKYKRDNGLTVVDTDVSTASANLQNAKTDIQEIENQIDLASYADQKIKTHKKFESFPLDMGISSQLTNQLFNSYNLLITERERLLFSAGENNPKIKIINEQLDGLKKDMSKSITIYQNELKIALEKKNSLYKNYSDKFNKIPLYEKFIRSIERQQGIKESLYILLLQKREEAAINVAVTGPSIKVVDYASSNAISISPKTNVIYGAAIFIGLLIPFLFVFVKNLLDNKIHNKKELSRIVQNTPIVSEIPFIGDDLKVMLDNDRSLLAESFRILRTNIGFLTPLKTIGKSPVILVTSTIKGEGKTFTSINLGVAYATLGKKVLAIGADLRNPQFHNYTDLEKSHPGLSNYLFDPSVDWRSLLVKNQFNSPGFDLIFSGVIPPNPAELLSNGRLEILLNEAKEEYDYIIIDTAPSLLVTDTLTISKHADVTLFVVRAGFTDKKIINYSLELKDKNKLRNIAYVLNNVGSNVGGFKYGYAYGYGYGYGEEEAVKKSWFKELIAKKFNIKKDL